MKDMGESIVEEQGIVFDEKGKPQDIRLGQKLRREEIRMTGDRSCPGRKALIEKRPPKAGQVIDEELLHSSKNEDKGGSEPPMDDTWLCCCSTTKCF
jgi:hypothetical protein